MWDGEGQEENKGKKGKRRNQGVKAERFRFCGGSVTKTESNISLISVMWVVVTFQRCTILPVSIADLCFDLISFKHTFCLSNRTSWIVSPVHETTPSFPPTQPPCVVLTQGAELKQFLCEYHYILQWKWLWVFGYQPGSCQWWVFK